MAKFFSIHGTSHADKFTFFSLNDKYLIKLGDFNVKIKGIEYNILMNNAGNFGHLFRINIDGLDYVSTNVWEGIDDNDDVKVKEYGTIVKIDEKDVCENDIVLDDIDYLPEKSKIIEEIKKKIKEDEEKKHMKELFWKNKSIIFNFSDDSDSLCYLVLQVKEENKYMYYWYSDEVFTEYEGNEYYDFKTDDMNKLLKFILKKIDELREGENIKGVKERLIKNSDNKYVLNDEYEDEDEEYLMYHISNTSDTILNFLKKHFILVKRQFIDNIDNYVFYNARID